MRRLHRSWRSFWLLGLLCLSTSVTAAESAVPSASTATPVRGLITAVSADRVTVRDAEGTEWQFQLSPTLDVSAAHLREHHAHAWPVTVSYRHVGSDHRLATRIAD